MRKQSLRKTTLLSLLGLKSFTASASARSTPSSPSPAQSTANLLSFSPSTETLVPTPSQASVNTPLPTGDFPFTISLAQPTGNGTTVSTPISQDVTVVQGTATRTRQSGSGAAQSHTAVVYLGQAVQLGYRKIGFTGALAAGVFSA